MAQPLQPNFQNSLLREGESTARNALVENTFSQPQITQPSMPAAPSGGFNVGGVDASDLNVGAGILKVLLNGLGATLDDPALRVTAQALGGAQAVYQLAQAISGGNLASFSGAASVGAVVSALLGAVAQATGNRDIATAAAVTSAATTTVAVAAGAAAAASGAAMVGMGPAALIMAPTALAYAGMSLADIWLGEKDAEQLGAKVSEDLRDLPISIEHMKQVPGLAGQLRDASPEQAAAIFNQLEGFQDFQQDSGVENLLKTGNIGIQGHTFFGNPYPGFDFPQYKDVAKQLEPYTQALDYGRLQAEDKARGGGQQISQPRTAADWATVMGSQGYFDPEGGDAIHAKYNEFLEKNYGPARLGKVQRESSQAYMAEHGAQDPEGRGYGPQHVQGATLIPGTEGWAMPEFPTWTPEAEAQLSQIQPGNFEAGIRALFGQNQAPSYNPFFQGAGMTVPGTPAYQPPINTIGQTGGMRAGIGRPGSFISPGSPLSKPGGATVNPNITQGVAGTTGFISPGSQV